MKPKHILFFLFFYSLFLFYPGDSHYLHIFAYNRDLFIKKEQSTKPAINPIPYLRSQYYPEVSAEGIYVVDLPSFTPILKRNEHHQFFPASTTKIITALVALDIYKPDDVITVKRVLTEGQVMGLVMGEKITLENLLYGILVHSGNDAAYAIADFYGFDNFIIKMNQKAKELKMNNSYFANPAGLDENSQVTTPFELALAGRELLKKKELSKIVATKEITISDIDFKYFHRLTNVNTLLGEIQGLGGLKTGYTEAAGENLISFYKHSGHQYIIVIMKSKDRFADTKNVVGWINENIDYINQ
jgi:serine-type D-Ala-D-Ala carboxypeptidase (penicillin-binding protein 5/6)